MFYSISLASLAISANSLLLIDSFQKSLKRLSNSWWHFRHKVITHLCLPPAHKGLTWAACKSSVVSHRRHSVSLSLAGFPGERLPPFFALRYSRAYLFLASLVRFRHWDLRYNLLQYWEQYFHPLRFSKLLPHLRQLVSGIYLSSIWFSILPLLYNVKGVLACPTGIPPLFLEQGSA